MKITFSKKYFVENISRKFIHALFVAPQNWLDYHDDNLLAKIFCRKYFKEKCLPEVHLQLIFKLFPSKCLDILLFSKYYRSALHLSKATLGTKVFSLYSMQRSMKPDSFGRYLRKTILGDFGKLFWTMPLVDYSGRHIWKTILGDTFGRLFWAIPLEYYSGRYLWKTILGDTFGRRFWAIPLEDYFLGIPSEDYFGRYLCKTILDDAFGRLFWATHLEDYFGRCLWKTVMGDNFGILFWAIPLDEVSCGKYQKEDY